MTEYKLIEQKLIESEYDVLRLDIIDWNRSRPWDHPGDAVRSISSFFINMAHYTIIETDLRTAPQRDDWPGWKHVGNHEYYGRLYWNWFHHNQKGDLHFSDAPDFSGILLTTNGHHLTTNGPHTCFARFWGDIGKVSARAFSDAQVQMHIGDLWISIIDEYRQVIVESKADIAKIYEESMSKKFPFLAE